MCYQAMAGTSDIKFIRSRRLGTMSPWVHVGSNELDLNDTHSMHGQFMHSPISTARTSS